MKPFWQFKQLPKRYKPRPDIRNHCQFEWFYLVKLYRESMVSLQKYVLDTSRISMTPEQIFLLGHFLFLIRLYNKKKGIVVTTMPFQKLTKLTNH